MSLKHLGLVLALLLATVCPLSHAQENSSPGSIGIVIAQRYDSTFATHRGPWIIVSVLDGSPAQRAGLRAGDTIVATGNRPAAGMSEEEFMNAVAGPPGAPLDLLIFRPSEAFLLPFRNIRRVASAALARPPERNEQSDNAMLEAFLTGGQKQGNLATPGQSTATPSAAALAQPGHSGATAAPDKDFSYIVFADPNFVGTWVSESASAVNYNRIEVELRADGTFTRTQTIRTPIFISSPSGGYTGSGPSLVTNKEGTWKVVDSQVVLSTHDDMRGLSKVR